MTEQQYRMEVSNLRLKFPGENSLVFKDISFSVSPGEKVLLLGPSGCGKSTLLQVMSGIIPDSFEVPLSHDAIQLPDSWGYVFQDPDTQFCMPYIDEELAFVLENLQVPRQDMEPLMRDVLNRVGLGSLELHSLIERLSQGMKQRLALASVLLLEPEVLFLDEPSALLDPEGTVKIWDAVRQVATDKTVIIVEHKIDQIADWVDRVVLFNQVGDIIADGPPTTIFTLHQQAIKQYGIWYPEVWDDYVDSPSFQAIISERAQATDHTQREALLQLENFKGYHGKEVKVEVPKAAIHQGSWLTVIGDNGAGKSTFLLSIMHLLRTTGHYELYGKTRDVENQKKLPPKELSLVFQNPELQFITNGLFDEIAFSLQLLGFKKQKIRQQVTDLLRMFHLDMDEGRHPFQLSTGQKRRLSVATALAHGPRILLLDEPTFGQDARNTFSILEKLEQLRREGTTIIMVTHDHQIVEHFATEVWTIDKGVLVNQVISQAPTREEQKVKQHA